MSSPGGRIGRIQGFKALASGECVRLGLPINSMMSASDMRIRMWVKITKGSISWSSGVCGGNSWVTKAKADAAEDGWFFYDSMMHSSSGITSNWGGSAHQGNLVMKGENADGSGEFDITIGMLHVSQLEWQDTRPGQSSNNWQGSYLDNLASRGIVIDVATGNMGIGMSNPSALPSEKLHVNGLIRATDASIVTTSDERTKQNITKVDIATSLERIKKLELVDYRFRKEYADAHGVDESVRRGFIAQQVGVVMPNAVTTGHDDKIKDIQLLQKDYIWTEAVGALQALVARVEKQDEEIALLKQLLAHKTAS